MTRPRHIRPHTPIRTCVGCRTREPQAALVRMVAVRTPSPTRAPDDTVEVSVDPRRRVPGRGAYVHPRIGCLDRALRRGGLSRALRARVTPAAAGALRSRFDALLAPASKGVSDAARAGGAGRGPDVAGTAVEGANSPAKGQQ